MACFLESRTKNMKRVDISQFIVITNTILIEGVNSKHQNVTITADFVPSLGLKKYRTNDISKSILVFEIED